MSDLPMSSQDELDFAAFAYENSVGVGGRKAHVGDRGKRSGDEECTGVGGKVVGVGGKVVVCRGHGGGNTSQGHHKQVLEDDSGQEAYDECSLWKIAWCEKFQVGDIQLIRRTAW